MNKTSATIQLLAAIEAKIPVVWCGDEESTACTVNQCAVNRMTQDLDKTALVIPLAAFLEKYPVARKFICIGCQKDITNHE